MTPTFEEVPIATVREYLESSAMQPATLTGSRGHTPVLR